MACDNRFEPFEEKLEYPTHESLLNAKDEDELDEENPDVFDGYNDLNEEEKLFYKDSVNVKEGTFLTPGITTEPTLVTTTDKKRNTAIVLGSFNGLIKVMGNYPLVDWTWGEEAGKTMTLKVAMVSFLREWTHDLYVHYLAQMIEKHSEKFDEKILKVINFETETQINKKAVSAKMRFIRPRWEIYKKEPDIVVFFKEEGKEEDFVVIEVTTGSSDLVYEKLEKYQSEESEGSLIVVILRRTSEAPMVTPRDSLKGILKDLQKKIIFTEEFITLFRSVAMDVGEVIKKEGLSNVSQSDDKILECTFVTNSAVHNFNEKLTQHFPKFLTQSIKDEFYTDEELEMAEINNTPTFKEVLTKVVTLTEKLNKRLLEWRPNAIELGALNYTFIKEAMTAGISFVGKQFVEHTLLEKPVVDIIYKCPFEGSVPDNHALRRKTIYPRSLDPQMKFFLLPPRGDETDLKTRFEIILGVMFDNNIPECDLLKEIKDILEVGKMKVTIENTWKTTKELLDIGKKAESSKGFKTPTYGSQNIKIDYPYHSETDAKDCLEASLEMKHGFDICLNEDMEHRFSIHPKVRQETFNMYGIEIGTLLLELLEGPLLTADLIQSRDAENIARNSQAVNYNRIQIVPLDGTFKLVKNLEIEGFINRTHLKAKKFEKEVKSTDHLARNEVAEWTNDLGQNVVQLNVGSGICLVRCTPVSEAESRVIRYIWIYRRKKNPKIDRKVNFGGNVIQRFDVGPEDEVVIVKMKRFPYQLFGEGKLAGRMPLILELLRRKHYHAVSKGEVLFGRTSITDKLLSVLLNHTKQTVDELKHELNRIAYSLMLKARSSSRENEGINLLYAQLGVHVGNFKDIKIGIDMVEMFRMSTIQWVTRQELMDISRKLEKAGFIKVTEYSQEGEIKKKIDELHTYKAYKKMVLEDPHGLLHPMLHQLGIRTDNLEADIENVMKISNMFDTKNPPKSKDLTEIPEELFEENTEESIKKIFKPSKPVILTKNCFHVRRWDQDTQLVVNVSGESLITNEEIPSLRRRRRRNSSESTMDSESSIDSHSEPEN